VECESFDPATGIAARLAACPAPAEVAQAAAAEVRPIADARNEQDLLPSRTRNLAQGARPPHW
jgi:hypothetical protein